MCQYNIWNNRITKCFFIQFCRCIKIHLILNTTKLCLPRLSSCEWFKISSTIKIRIGIFYSAIFIILLSLNPGWCGNNWGLHICQHSYFTNLFCYILLFLGLVQPCCQSWDIIFLKNTWFFLLVFFISFDNIGVRNVFLLHRRSWFRPFSNSRARKMLKIWTWHRLTTQLQLLSAWALFLPNFKCVNCAFTFSCSKPCVLVIHKFWFKADDTLQCLSGVNFSFCGLLGHNLVLNEYK